ncbi:hypothetical protein KW799_02805 [Candidatus Parcubacteria bacterium]|nr:hypothetical protein [Candidatus Parcubacteria bacterium]
MFKDTKNSLKFAGAALLVAVAWASYYFYPSRAADLKPETSKSYVSGRYGISFLYPNYYRLEQKDIGDARRARHLIMLTDATLDPLPKDGEGPPSITIDILENDGIAVSAEDFIRNDDISNYRLGNGLISTSTEGPVEGLGYSWSGLYEGRSLVVVRPGYIFMFSVTRFGPDDRIVADFSRILRTTVLK